MAKIIEFETERLKLRQWQTDDYQPFSTMSADWRVMAFFPSILVKQASDAMAERCKALIAERGWGFWATELKTTHEFIGFAGLNTPSPDLPVSANVEIGWRLAFEHWGRGLATEAAKAVLNVAFADLGFAEIISFTSLGNHRSRAVMERIGMVETALLFDHPAVPESSPHRRHCLYRINSERWANKS